MTEKYYCNKLEFETRVKELLEFYVTIESNEENKPVNDDIERILEICSKLSQLFDVEEDNDESFKEQLSEAVTDITKQITWMLIANKRSIKLSDGQKIEEKEESETVNLIE